MGNKCMYTLLIFLLLLKYLEDLTMKEKIQITAQRAK